MHDHNILDVLCLNVRVTHPRVFLIWYRRTTRAIKVHTNPSGGATSDVAAWHRISEAHHILRGERYWFLLLYYRQYC